MMVLLNHYHDAIVILHLVATAGMFGIVLFVQIVQYPMLGKIHPANREEFEREYSTRASSLITPIMLIEAASMAAILFLAPYDLYARAGAALFAVICLVTFGISVPCHNRLSREWRSQTYLVLLWSNFFRCLLWGARVVIAVCLLSLVAR
jgi:hypothetical protein